jgi:hypothetical protein
MRKSILLTSFAALCATTSAGLAADLPAYPPPAAAEIDRPLTYSPAPRVVEVVPSPAPRVVEVVPSPAPRVVEVVPPATYYGYDGYDGYDHYGYRPGYYGPHRYGSYGYYRYPHYGYHPHEYRYW